MSRWLRETGGTSGKDYAARFAALAAAGADLHGEARYVDGLLSPGARVLDAGCGTGRVASELARRGHRVTGVDNDASMLAQARADTGVTWVQADLATLDLDERFDLVVMAGNVIVFVEPGSEQQVVDRLAAHLVPGGLLVSGWRTSRLALSSYEQLVSGLRRGARQVLQPVVRHATWDADPWVDGADWCVAVDRSAPAGA
jgi:2-polyprenyl-3-methyl-5-hydroxy-6-metoxy-1,4-benzoquinol methylase